MRRRLLLVLLAVLLTVPSAPFAQDDLAGTYAVSGEYPNGKPYTGHAEIINKGGGVYVLQWLIVTEQGPGELVGIGFVSAGVLHVAAGPMTPNGPLLANAAAYTMGETLAGSWVMPGISKIMPETLTKIDAGHPPPVPTSPDVRERA